MEFMNRGGRPSQSATNPASSPASTGGGSHKKNVKGLAGLNIASVMLLFFATALVASVLVYMGVWGPSKEADQIKKDQMQAVFLNGGQVYFGDIQDLNSSSIRLSNIYYLRVNQQVQPNQEETEAASNDISLVKLGCELHGPEDEMLINREQVIFWENLKTDGQVAKAVEEYVKQNPKGQNCETTQQQSTQETTNP